jgi:predicted MFS family arabinose efflux permease
MTSARDRAPMTSVRRLALSAGVLFFANGATYGNWIPRLPEIKDRLGVTNSGLGVALLGGGLGGLVGSLAVGAVMSRVGSRRMVLVTMTLVAAAMTLVAFVSQAWMLLVVLSLIGLFDVCADVAINAQGVIAQEQLGRSIMNRLHGMWSLGFASGTVVGSLGAGLDLDLRVQVVIVAGSLIAAVWFVARWLVKIDPSHHDEAAVAPSSRQLGVIAIALAVVGAAAIALEGMPNEWAALIMRDEFGIGAWAGFGTVAFGTGMLLGRFSGDYVQNRIGSEKMFRLAMGLILLGFAVVLATSQPWLALCGLFVSGTGQAVIFPRLYLLAARVPGLSAGAGLGALMVGLRIGGMATTLSMGALADAYDLRVALAIVAAVSFVLLLVSNAVVSRRV